MPSLHDVQTCTSNTATNQRMLISVYRVNEAVGTRLLVLVDLVDNQEHHTHQESQGTDHQQGHLKKTTASTSAEELLSGSVRGQQQ